MKRSDINARIEAVRRARLEKLMGKLEAVTLLSIIEDRNGTASALLMELAEAEAKKRGLIGDLFGK